MLALTILSELRAQISTSTQYATVITVLLYFSWSLWRFTIVPKLWPQEPLVFPYWIPYIGHTKAFMSNAEALYNKAYKHFGSSEPFALVVGGSTTVIVRDVQDVASVWKNTTALTFDPFVHGVFKAFGMPPSFVRTVFTNNPETLIQYDARATSLLVTDNPTGKCYVHLQSEWLRTQLLQKDLLEKLQERYHSFLLEHLILDEILATSIPDTQEKTDVSTISLAKFSRGTVSLCGMKTFLGEEIVKFAPSFIQDYQQYERDSWKIFYHFPPLLAKDLHAAKNRVTKNLEDYMALPDSKRPGVAWIFKTMDYELQCLGLSSRDRAGIVMLILWAINNNAHYTAFWIFAHMLHDKPLMEEVRSEIDQACSPDGSVDIGVLLSQCPHLDALWFETLRRYNSASVVRKAQQSCVIGGKTIHKGDAVIAPFRQFHLNPDIFGHDSEAFNSGRWIKKSGLQRTKGYAPFGGGHTHCPGRLFAQREIYMFVALTLYRYDIFLGDEEATAGAPPVDLSRPAPGSMGAARDITVKIKPRTTWPAATFCET